jgi:Bacterial Ig-like domain
MNAIFNSSKSATVSRTLVLGICLVFAALGLAAIPTHKALAAAPAFTVASLENNSSTLVTVKITGTSFATFVHSTTTTADATDLAKITYAATTPQSATIASATEIDAQFLVSAIGTGKSGGALGIAADTVQDGGSTHNLIGSIATGSITDNANPLLLSVTKSLVANANVLTFVYSEIVTVSCSGGASTIACGDTTTAGTVAGFGGFATTGDVTVPSLKNTVAGSGSTTVTVTLATQTGGYLNYTSTTEPNGVFTPVAAAAVVDAAAHQVSTASTPTASPVGNTTWDLTKPTITSITLADAAGNNGKIDQAAIVFSETVLGAKIIDGNALLGGATHTGTFTAHADASTFTFNLSADTLAVDTSIANVKFNYSTAIADRAGNLLNTTTPGTIVDADNNGKLVDGAAPILVSVATSASASRNLVTLVYSEPMTVTNGASSTNIGDVTVAGTVTGIGSFATGGAATVPVTAKNTISGNGTNTIVVALADQVGGYFTNASATTPSGVFTPVSNAFITDNSTALNHVNAANHPTAGGTAWTLTQPTIATATDSDANHDGRMDTVTLVFSAPVRDSNISNADALLGGATHVGTFTTGTANDATTVFALTTDNLAVDTATAPDFTYSAATTKITDLFGNLLNTTVKGAIATADVVEADGANPVIVTTSPVDSSTGAALDANVVITFSEPMNGPGTACTFSSLPDPGTFGAITNAANWSNGNKTVTLTHLSTYSRGDHPTITIGGCTAAAGSPTALATNPSIPNPFTFAVIASGGSGAGGSASTPTPTVTLSIPAGGATYTAGQQIGISWIAADGAYTSFKISYSSDNGNNWTVLSSTVSGSSSSYTWMVPTSSTTQGLIKVDGVGSDSTVLASATSAAFTVVGTTVAPPAVAPPAVTPPTTPPAVDSTVSGTYDASTAKANNPDFNTDMNLPAASSSTCVSGTLIKGSLSAVYYCGADGKRYVFVNDKAYFSWYPDFSGVQTVSDATLASLMIGGNITYRPGTRMVKIQSDPKTYVVARGGILRWVQTEAAAARLFGANWNQMIDDVSDSFFVNYTVGSPITM